MKRIVCRYCGTFFFEALGKDTKIRITCRRCKRFQVVDLNVAEEKTWAPSHLEAARLTG